MVPGKPTARRSPRRAFLYGAPIGLLGGLIGLGGAEFRLPVLAGVLRYTARRAVALNLAISLITLLGALATRAGTLSVWPTLNLLPVALAMIAGGVIAAYKGTALMHRLPERRLERLIFVLLVAIGAALIVEAFLPQEITGLLPAGLRWRLSAGVLFGLGIGLVSSLLGVAGGELIIPTLVFAFGVDIKTAGTASLLISLPTVVVGVVRQAHLGAFADRRDLTETVAPMGLGSVVGATLGGLLVSFVPAGILKLVLGVILNVSAFKIFYSPDRDSSPRARPPSG